MDKLNLAKTNLYISLMQTVRDRCIRLLDWADFVLEPRYVTLGFRFSRGMIEAPTYTEIRQRVTNHLDRNRIGCHSVYLEDTTYENAVLVKLHCCY